jgi:hypothetical protein
LLIGQSISVGIGLLVERHVTPYTGLVTFIVCYFAMFWMAWRFAVCVTEPRSGPVALAVRSARRRDWRGPLSSMGISKIQTETLTQEQKEAPPKRCVCTENSMLIDYVSESPNVTGDDRSVMLLPDPCVYRKPDPY